MMKAGHYTAEEMIAIIQAWKDGEQIEYLNCGCWVDASEPSWNFSDRTYRIKPKTKYIPFTNDDLLLGRAVQELGSTSKRLIVYQDNKGVGLTSSWGTYYLYYNVLLKNYRFVAGDPICGRYGC